MKSAFQHSGNKLVYHWRNSVGALLFLTVFALFWNALVLTAVYAVMTGSTFNVNDVPYTSLAEAYDQNPIIVIFLLFPLVGLGMGYAALCCWVNTTTFSSDGFHLIKKTSPLPVSGDFTLSRSSIAKVFVRQGPSPQTRSRTQSFTVVAYILDGKEKIIHSAGLSLEDATLLEKWIKERLNLTET